MNWFTENPWPPALICLAAAGLAVAWAQTRSQPRDRTLGFVGALGGVLAALAIFPLERSIVTDRERIELDVRQLVADFTAQDEDATLSHFSPGAVEWRKQVQLALKLVKVEGIDVKDLSVKLFGQDYARTLALWRERFLDRWSEIKKLGYSEEFRRKWVYYLSYCEAGFAEGSIDVGIYQYRRPL